MTIENPQLYDSVGFNLEAPNFIANELSWELLNTVYQKIRHKPNESYPQREADFWKKIESHPLTPASIQQLIKDGWRLYYATPGSHYGGAQFKSKSLFVDISIDPYERDKILLHEFVHIHYGKNLLNDSLQIDGHYNKLRHENRVIVEWLARQYRADPQLLRAAVLCFGLEPKVYDKASLEAFPEYGPKYGLDTILSPQQKYFPFAAWDISHLRKKLSVSRLD